MTESQMPPRAAAISGLLRRGENFLKQRQADNALGAAKEALAIDPACVPARLIKARAHQLLHDYEAMQAEAVSILSHQPDHPDAELAGVEAHIGLGELGKAIARLSLLRQRWDREPLLLGRLAEIETHMGRHETAADALERAVALVPGEPALLYNLSSALIAMGRMDEAEDCLDRLIALRPDDYDAYYNRATLRHQTSDRNHVRELEKVLSSGLPLAGEVQVRYALAKELEDLGEDGRSFQHLSVGAQKRRSLLQYRVEDDIETMHLLMEVFSQEHFETAATGRSDFAPIFVVGLPRTGTTLVDRILSSHSQVKSIGEVTDLPIAMTRLAGAVRSKAELVAASARIDPDRFAREVEGYMFSRVPDVPVPLEKTPLNYLYIGLIAQALPRARIIHLTRDPMDAAYAMYKTLFRMGYPFSYDLDDLGKYIRAKSELMAHWDRVLPGRVIHVGYEELTSDPDQQIRGLVTATGLDWEEQCLTFDQNTDATATASAAQVRQPIYTSSIGRWKRHEEGLAPLRKYFPDEEE